MPGPVKQQRCQTGEAGNLAVSGPGNLPEGKKPPASGLR